MPGSDIEAQMEVARAAGILPRTVPSDPRAAEDERSVREAVEELTRQRDIAMARQQAAALVPTGEQLSEDLMARIIECFGPPTAGWRSEGGHSIDWDAFDRAVDELSGSAVRALFKIEARKRADGTPRTDDSLHV